jgi:hypothetical protein
MKFQPVFIIGAARSGTNILRNTLSSLNSITTWPCDEINLVFRHGNRSFESDEFNGEQVNKIAKHYIKSVFKKLSTAQPNSLILEKTCANSLRIPFINKIFPESRFIFIVRNGYDVTSSAEKRWKSSMELKYLYSKTKYVPKRDIPYYLIKFIQNRINQYQSSENRMSVWGPVYSGMLEDLSKLSLMEVCAKQWSRSVSKAWMDLQTIDASRVEYLSYESFVNDPLQHVNHILRWLKVDYSPENLTQAVRDIRRTSVGKGAPELPKDELLMQIIDPIMYSIYTKIHVSQADTTYHTPKTN